MPTCSSWGIRLQCLPIVWPALLTTLLVSSWADEMDDVGMFPDSPPSLFFFSFFFLDELSLMFNIASG